MTMGMLAHIATYVKELKLPNGFSVCDLGDQFCTFNVRRLASEFYKELGCKRYVSIDGNGRGTLTHDLNLPLSAVTASNLGQFDLVTDFGTGEHVFNQYQVWKTIHYLTKTNGYIAFDRPAQGYPEHCYYNVHMCLFNDLAAANNYEVVRLERSNGRNGGELIRGVFRKVNKDKFRIPQQGRYKKLLRPITEPELYGAMAIRS